MSALTTPTACNEDNVNRLNLNSNEKTDWIDACSEVLEFNEMDELWSVD